MLERYFVLPDTIDRVRSSWIAEPIERYVVWLTERGYAARTVCRRVPIVMRFGEFAHCRGASKLEDLPNHIEAFVAAWVAERAQHKKTEQERKTVAKEARTPVRQMLRLVLESFAGNGRRRRPENPFWQQAPGFFAYLREERGLRESSLNQYTHHLREFAAYLGKIGLADLGHLSPLVFSGFVTDLKQRVAWASLRNACGVLRVFLRYLHRQGVLAENLSQCVEAPQTYRLSHISRSITWDEVGRMLKAVDQRQPAGKRDYAILLLLVTYGLRARSGGVDIG